MLVEFELSQTFLLFKVCSGSRTKIAKTTNNIRSRNLHATSKTAKHYGGVRLTGNIYKSQVNSNWDNGFHMCSLFWVLTEKCNTQKLETPNTPVLGIYLTTSYSNKIGQKSNVRNTECFTRTRSHACLVITKGCITTRRLDENRIGRFVLTAEVSTNRILQNVHKNEKKLL